MLQLRRKKICSCFKFKEAQTDKGAKLSVFDVIITKIAFLKSGEYLILVSFNKLAVENC